MTFVAVVYILAFSLAAFVIGYSSRHGQFQASPHATALFSTLGLCGLILAIDAL